MSTTPSKRSIACRECHKRKVKCSGNGPPCTACQQARVECEYPARDKQVKVGQRYLDKILEENRRLSAAVVSAANTPAAPAPPPSGAVSEHATPRADNADRNPVLEEHPWFMVHEAVDLPIYINETADAAFVTRLRQTASTRPVNHLARVQYVDDDTLRSFSETPPVWPSSSRLRFLVQTALETACKTWHIVRRSAVERDVQNLLNDPSSCHWVTASRIWALMAIGDAFSSRCTLPDQPFPGAKYWARAMQLVNMTMERPRLCLVEVYVLLAYYAALMNRRHTAVLLSSQSLRLCLILGLHIEISDTQLRDPVLREHRCRLWWTAYRFDRLWAGRNGVPPSIPDDSIEIRLPSDEGLPPGSEVDFRDASHLIMSVRLSRILCNAVNILYVWKRQQTSFSERVQEAVRSLRDWAEEIPPHLRLKQNEPLEPRVQYMHLAFNQSVIVVTRPVLLHLFRQSLPRHTATTNATPAQPFSDPALSLTTACVRYARQSMDLLKRSWADGTFLTFDYFHVQFLFSSATILALSALLQGTGWANDREDFLLACSFLHQLEQNGNFVAKEFSAHVDALKKMMLEEERGGGGDGGDVGQPATAVPGLGNLNPPLQDFLDFPEIDLDFMESDARWLEFQELCWPQMEDGQGGLS
ncbi:hypothetical protein Q7P37_007104 [Cladosporium fusiforme]